MKLAKANHQTVLSSSDENRGADMTVEERLNAARNSTIARVDENGHTQPSSAEQQADRNNPQSVRPDTSSSAPSSTTASSSPSTANARSVGTIGRARTSLPETASDLPLLALLGAVMLVLGVVLKQRRVSDVNRHTLR